MDFFPKRSLSESSSDDEPPRKPSNAANIAQVPKKRPLVSSDADSSSNASSFPTLPKKRKYKEEIESPPSEPDNEMTKSSSSDSDDNSESESSSFSSPTFGNMPVLGDGFKSPSAKPSNLSSDGIYNGVAKNLMEKMGYKAGEGLGKHGQGRTQIIEASKQRGRRGLGLKIKGLEPTNNEWQSGEEHITVDEEVLWLPECTLDPPNIKDLRKWLREGEKKLSIDDETEFCDANILKNVIGLKSVFDELEPEEMRKARTRSNPFETIRGVIFQNRAAMKMANMDAIFDFMFTAPKDEEGKPLVREDELLYFADICAGPGGFSEYILWRKKWHCKGFGFTLRGMNDFKLGEFFSGPPETFEPHYGVNGREGDGDIFKPDNLREFRRFVLENTDKKGIHFVMADGGFSVEGQENIQEILSKQLYLCQFLCALSILQINGHFVCKVFDIFTPFSVGLIYLLYRAFKKVCIHKPNTSRPANSERYVICKWKREGTKDIEDYMFEVNCQLASLGKNEDIVEVVPLSILREDEDFYNYVVESNNRLGEWQVVGLAKIKAFAQNTDLYESRQSDLRKECLAKWKIPDKMRSAPARPDPNAKFRELLSGDSVDYMSHRAEELNLDNLNAIQGVHDYHCIISSIGANQKSDRGFFLGLGRSHIYKWDGLSSTPSWNKVDFMLELPADTLIYGEVVQELKGESRAQRKITAIHVIDVLYIGGENFRHYSFKDRIKQAERLVKAVYKPSRNDHVPIRAKEIYKLTQIDDIFERLQMTLVKGSSNNRRLCYRMPNNHHFLPNGVFLIKTVQDPWTVAMSKKNNCSYRFNKKTNKSSYDWPEGSIANFKSCFTNRFFWSWEEGVKLLDGQDARDGKVHRHTISNFVAKKTA